MELGRDLFSKELIISALNKSGAKGVIELIDRCIHIGVEGIMDCSMEDAWANEFFEDWSKNTKVYITMREKIRESMQFSSVHNYEKFKPLVDLNSPACILTMLYSDLSWIEIYQAVELTGYNVTAEEKIGRAHV